MFHEFSLNSTNKKSTHAAKITKNKEYNNDVLDITPTKQKLICNTFTLDKGTLEPVYTELADAPLRLYICGPSGCGKSTYQI